MQLLLLLSLSLGSVLGQCPFAAHSGQVDNSRTSKDLIENYARGSGANPRAEAGVDYEAVMADLEVVMRDSKVASAHNL